jgi:hypothetical protein
MSSNRGLITPKLCRIIPTAEIRHALQSNYPTTGVIVHRLLHKLLIERSPCSARIGEDEEVRASLPGIDQTCLAYPELHCGKFLVIRTRFK